MVFTTTYKLDKPYFYECFDQSLPYSKRAQPKYFLLALLVEVRPFPIAIKYPDMVVDNLRTMQGMHSKPISRNFAFRVTLVWIASKVVANWFFVPFNIRLISRPSVVSE